MGGIGMCGIGTGASPSFSEELDINDSVSGLVLSNNSLYNLHYFAWELVHLEESSSSKMACIEWKMVFLCICCMKQYLLSSYLMNIINSECGASLLAWIPVESNT